MRHRTTNDAVQHQHVWKAKVRGPRDFFLQREPVRTEAVFLLVPVRSCQRGVKSSNILSCKETSTKRVYNCTSTTKSVWLKAFEITDYTVKQNLEHCNKKLNKKYVELS